MAAFSGVDFMPASCQVKRCPALASRSALGSRGWRIANVSALLLLVLAGLAAWLIPTAAQPAKSRPSEAAKPVRIPWTTSRVVGSPEPPPPFKVVRAFPNLKFEHPLLIARPPGSDRLFVGEQAGVLYSFADRPDARADLFCDLRKEIRPSDFLHGAK